MGAEDPTWRRDVLPGYEARDLPLPGAEPAPGEPETELVGTLVRRVGGRDVERAVLYLHGWNDYFFQTHLGDFFAAQGFAFFALDLRRYGRSLRPGQLNGWINDLDLYAAELDAALELVRADHPHVTLMGHSTGGLVGVLWADRRPGALDGVILNSPWLDLQGSAMLRALGSPIVDGLGQRLPTAALPLADSGHYARTLHVSQEGEWSYEQEWKSFPSWPVRAGWLRAVLQGHQRVAAGLDVDAPVLVLASVRSDFRRRWDAALRAADIVLDVEQIAQRAVRLGAHVTVVRVEGGMHDLVLSDQPARERTLTEMARWVRGYLDPLHPRP